MELYKCICGSLKPKDQCCESYIIGTNMAPTPEALMRSRFVAFATKQVDYIMSTEQLQQPNDVEDLKQWCDITQWVKLEVLSATETKSQGKVHFKAHFILEGRTHVLEELSDFTKTDGKWLYVGGEVKGE